MVSRYEWLKNSGVAGFSLQDLEYNFYSEGQGAPGKTVDDYRYEYYQKRVGLNDLSVADLEVAYLKTLAEVNGENTSGTIDDLRYLSYGYPDLGNVMVVEGSETKSFPYDFDQPMTLYSVNTAAVGEQATSTNRGGLYGTGDVAVLVEGRTNSGTDWFTQFGVNNTTAAPSAIVADYVPVVMCAKRISITDAEMHLHTGASVSRTTLTAWPTSAGAGTFRRLSATQSIPRMELYVGKAHTTDQMNAIFDRLKSQYGIS